VEKFPILNANSGRIGFSRVSRSWPFTERYARGSGYSAQSAPEFCHKFPVLGTRDNHAGSTTSKTKYNQV